MKETSHSVIRNIINAKLAYFPQLVHNFVCVPFSVWCNAFINTCCYWHFLSCGIKVHKTGNYWERKQLFFKTTFSFKDFLILSIY